jgi:hypothetical protein
MKVNQRVPSTAERMRSKSVSLNLWLLQRKFSPVIPPTESNLVKFRALIFKCEGWEDVASLGFSKEKQRWSSFSTLAEVWRS